MASVFDVADYILTLSTPDEGDLISHLKLQKLLYYSQGTHLALTEEPLFDENILRWEHGPVVREIFNKYRDNGSDPIAIPEDFDIERLSEVEKLSIDEAYDEFGQFSAWKLRNMTHDEPPWIDTPSNDVISKAKIQDFFKTLLIE